MPHQFECYQEGCAFMIRADTSEEVVSLVQRHAEEQHGLTLGDEDVEAEIEPA
jgi:predicted small metal-binding protein